LHRAILRDGDEAFETKFESERGSADGEFDGLFHEAGGVGFEDGAGGKGGFVESSFGAALGVAGLAGREAALERGWLGGACISC